MKLHILSDLHFEFGKWPRQVDVNTINADVTILAGDIGVGLQGLEWALSIDRPVIYVMGNHEFYGQRPMEHHWRKAREKVADTHVLLLENDAILIADPQHPGEQVRFLGATLWTDFRAIGPGKQDECMEAAGRSMTDYNSIFVTRRGPLMVEYGMGTRHQGDRLTPRMTLAFHQESRDFLETELKHEPDPMGLMPSWRKTVVVTHHAPSVLSLDHQKAVEHGDAAYASDLDDLVSRADLWVHGHTHKAVNYPVGFGRVVSNPRGYVGHQLVHEFDPAFVLEV